MPPLNSTTCPRCSKRVHLMPGISVLPQFASYMFLVCWKCRIVAHTRREDRKWIPIKKAKALQPNSR